MLDNIKKTKLRQWAFDIGFENSIKALRKEHNDLFLTLGEEEKEYSIEKIERFQDIVQAIYYVNMLDKMNIKQIPIF